MQQFPPPTPDPFSDQPGSAPRGHVVAAWLVIGMVCTATILTPMLAPDEAREEFEAGVGLMMAEVQGRYLVGVAEMVGYRQRLYEHARDELNTGPVAQRQRFIVLAAELVGAEAAAQHLADLDALIDWAKDPTRERPLERGPQTRCIASGTPLRPEQRQVQEILGTLYQPGEPDLLSRIEGLTQPQRELLATELGWFGRLALAPRGTPDRAARQSALRPAMRVVLTFLIGVTVIGMGMLGGLVGLVVMFALALSGRVRSRMARPGGGRGPHAVYAETFAIWIALFLGLQVLAAVVTVPPGQELLIAAAMFFMSLIALAWPVVRGVPWADVREDIGLHWGSEPAVEPLWGVAGYAMALPLLAMGLLLTLVLAALQGLFAEVPGPLDPAGGPAHPVIVEVVAPGLWPKVQLLFLAAVAAPIVEEIMFRGVLYRHLRDATRNMGLIGSIIIATLINTFVFAIIHPQGWVAAPVLMSLAVAFTLMREWRGTIVPAVVMHAVNNGVVMTFFLVVLAE